MDEDGIRRHGHLDLLELILRADAHLNDRCWRRVEVFDRVVDVEAGRELQWLVAVSGLAVEGSAEVACRCT